jgi:phosphoribosylanthranilate isomerase
VVVNARQDELSALRDSGCFEAVQFHGDETPEFCAGAGFPIWIRAVRVRDERSLLSALRYDTPYLLLDGWLSTAYGGTGRRLDWDSAAEFVAAQPTRRVILAGGLGPENVREAIRTVRPHGVDTASGVESSPGRKDTRRVADFVRAARSS